MIKNQVFEGMVSRFIVLLFIPFLLIQNGCFEGSDGSQGVQGPQGEQGPKGDQGLPGVGVYDKQIRLLLDFSSGLASNQVAGTIFDDEYMVTKFNVSNYIGVNRVIFSASILSSDVTNTCTVELYNVTDGVPISESAVLTNSTTAVWVDSGNIINEFPDKEVNLGLRIRSQNDGVMVSCWRAVIFLYRD